MRILTSLIIVLLFSACGESEPQPKTNYNANLSPKEIQLQGEALFKSNCQVCHSCDKNAPSGMAPVLENIKENWPNKSELIAYIKNAPEEMQKTERAREIYRDWKNKAQMPAFTALSMEEIDCIINFLYKKTE